MAKVLSSISLDAPAAPVSAAPADTFAFSGTPSVSGSGGTQRFDIRFEVDDGGGYVPIAASGSGLITADTNPVTNLNNVSPQSITVTCDTAGSYTIRIAGAPSTGGAYTVTSSTQTVEVAAAAEAHSGSFAATGGGVIVESASTSRAVSAAGTGGGVAVVDWSGAHAETFAGTGGGVAVESASTQRAADLNATGGGVVTWTYSTGVTSEAHSGSFAATGGGVAVVMQSTERAAVLAATGGGVMVETSGTQRSLVLTATAAGVAVITDSTQRSIALAATGGGVAVVDATAASGAEAHSGSFSAVGGGVASSPLSRPACTRPRRPAAGHGASMPARNAPDPSLPPAEAWQRLARRPATPARSRSHASRRTS